MSHTAPRPPSRVSQLAVRFGALAIVLLVLYYSVTATLEVRQLHAQLDRQNAETEDARAQAAGERQLLLVRLDTLQSDLDNARAEVASLREQLITAGITPVTVLPSGAAADPQPQPDELDQDPRPQEAAGAPETAPQAQTPQEPAPVAPAPAPVAPVAPVVPPVPDAPRGILRGENPLVCVLTLCI